MVPDLRDYQEYAVDALRAGILEGWRRQMLCLATGAGKTIIAAYLCQEALARGKRAVFVADRIALVDQASRTFGEYGIDHGVAQGENTFGRGLPMQVCSAQTIEARGYWPKADIIFIDEAHVQRAKVAEFLRRWDGPAVGLSATPMTPGLGRLWERVIQVGTTDRLIAADWLVPLRVYAGKAADMEGAATNRAGEWTAKAAEERGRVVIGDVVSNWVRRAHSHFGGPVRTLVFSATVAHGEELCEEFQDAGYDFRQISYRDSNDERRRRLIAMYREGMIDGLISCECLTRGFDVPATRILIDARSYRKSLASHIQMIGRVMRPYPSKEFGLVLDHSGNWERFMPARIDFFRNGCTSLDDGKKREQEAFEPREREDSTCPCGLIREPGQQVCPGCGRERPRRTDFEVVPGELVEVTGAEGATGWARPDLTDHVWGQVCLEALRRKRGDVEEAARVSRVYFKSMTGAWPPWPRNANLDRFAPADMPDDRLVSELGGKLAAYARSRP